MVTFFSFSEDSGKTNIRYGVFKSSFSLVSLMLHFGRFPQICFSSLLILFYVSLLSNISIVLILGGLFLFKSACSLCYFFSF